jgi:AdoMet-dependent rRNA methyltransferase SPB1
MARKKNKAKKKFEKIKQQANVISNQEEVSERNKIKQIQKLYNKEMRDDKTEKKYTVSRSFKSVKNPKSHGKTTTFVDKRLKKDKRAAKRILKDAKGKKSGGGKKRKGKGGKLVKK